MNKVHVFESHFDGSDTVIIGNWCRNGCQIFHKKDASTVFNSFRVPNWKRKHVMDAFSDEPIDFALLYADRGPVSELMFIKMCDDAKLLENFVDHYRWIVREEIAFKNIDSLNNLLKDDEDPDVLYAIAKRSRNFEILNHIIRTCNEVTVIQEANESLLQIELGK